MLNPVDPQRALVNALILASLATTIMLMSLGVSGLLEDPLKAAIAAILTFSLWFFSRLALEYGLNPNPKPPGQPEPPWPPSS